MSFVSDAVNVTDFVESSMKNDGARSWDLKPLDLYVTARSVSVFQALVDTVSENYR